MWNIKNEQVLRFHSLLCTICLISPPNINENLLIPFVVTYLLLVNIVFGYLWIQRQNDELLSSRPTVILMLDHIAQSTYYLTNHFMLVRMIFFYRQPFMKFGDTLIKLDRALGVFWKEKKKLFVSYLIEVGPTIFVTINLIAFSWTTDKRTEARYYLLELIQIDQYVLNVFMIYSFQQWLTEIYATLNKHLRELSIHLDGRSNRLNMKRITFSLNIKSILVLHKELNDLIHDFNDIFGMNILSIVLGICIYIITLIMDYILMITNFDFSDFMYAISLGIAIVSIFSFVTNMQPVLLALGGTMVKKESKKILSTCFDALNNLPILPKSPKDMIMREGFIMLVGQYQASSSQITAAGFFPVDLSMLGFIVGCTTSYFIVILQFIQATSSKHTACTGKQ